MEQDIHKNIQGTARTGNERLQNRAGGYGWQADPIEVGGRMKATISFMLLLHTKNALLFACIVKRPAYIYIRRYEMSPQ